MPEIKLSFPTIGKVTNYALSQQPPNSAALLNNVRPYDVSKERVRGGQRPGIAHWGNGDELGGIGPVVAITSVTYQV
jgi:hypothetical protein